MYHIIIDGMSSYTMIDELWQIYEGKTLDLIELNYLDYAVWQNKNKENNNKNNKNNKDDKGNETSKQYFLDIFKDGIPENEMPTRPIRRDILPPTNSLVQTTISIDKIKEKAKTLGITPYSLLFASVGSTLAKYCVTDDVVLGASMNGRNQTKTQNRLGLFVNILPV